MQIRLTVEGRRVRRDALVAAPGPVPLADVLPHLAAGVGAPAASVTVDGRACPPGARIGVDLRDGVVVGLGRPPVARPGAGLVVVVVGGPHAGRSVPLGRGRVVVGRDEDCDLHLADDRLSRHHVELAVRGDRVVVRDLGSTNGTTVEGRDLGTSAVDLPPGGLVRVGDALLAVRTTVTVPARVAADGPVLRVQRAPRPRGTATTDEPLEVPGGTVDAPPTRVQWLAALLPGVAGVVLALALGSPVFLVLSLLSPVVVLGGALGDRRHWRRERRRRAADRRKASAESSTRVAAVIADETVRRRAAHPDPATVALVGRTPSVRLWERSAADADALEVRLGTADLPSRATVRTDGRVRPAGVVPAVPVVADLRRAPLGIVGAVEDGRAVATAVLAQLVTLHGPSAVRVAVDAGLLADPAWSWLRWAPHLDGPATASGWTVGVGAVRVPWEPSARTTAVCLATTRDALPAGCDPVVELTGAEAVVRGERVLVDRFPAAAAEALARRLAPLRDADPDAGAVPSRCRLADVVPTARPDVPVEAVRAAWSAGDDGPDHLRAALGHGPDGPLVVDLVGDGPHALVAGTTGSGKSELLRSLVVGLAATVPPDRLAFVLVDHKGGAALAGCAGLPHTVGTVTDLEPRATARALRALEAELTRREAALAAAGVADLAALWRRDGDGPARLVVVVDEFAALATTHPEQLAALVAIGQRGRSLGLHLVLATQRPAGVVSPEIRANTSLRIALRVTDDEDSRAVLDAPCAAAIDPRTPGRAWVRTAGDLRPVQTGRFEAVPPPLREPVVTWADDVVAGGVPADPGDDGTASFVRRVADAARARPGPGPLWLPELPTRLAPPSSDDDDTGAVVVGLADDPAGRRRSPVRVTTGDAVAVVGSAGTGRTTALLTTALAGAAGRSPAELEVLVGDGSGRLAGLLAPLPHVTTCLGPDDAELVVRLLARAAGSRPSARHPGPARLVLLDDWDRLVAAADDTTASALLSGLAGLVRAAPQVATAVLVSGDRRLLHPRSAPGVATRWLLALEDREDYALAGVPRDAVPAVRSPGRAVRTGDAAHLQLADPGDDPGAAVAAVAARWAGSAARDDAVRVVPLPRRVTAVHAPGAGVVLGVGGDAGEPCRVDLLRHRARLLVTGPPRSGRSTALLTVLRAARADGSPVVVAAGPRSPLPAAAARAGTPVLAPDRPPGPAPTTPTLVLVDDADRLAGTVLDEGLTAWAASDAPLAVVAAARTDEAAAAWTGLLAAVRRERTALLLCPGPAEGELVGLRLPRRTDPGPPGRGLLVGDPSWGGACRDGGAVRLQVAVDGDVAA